MKIKVNSNEKTLIEYFTKEAEELNQKLTVAEYLPGHKLLNNLNEFIKWGKKLLEANILGLRPNLLDDTDECLFIVGQALRLDSEFTHVAEKLPLLLNEINEAIPEDDTVEKGLRILNYGAKNLTNAFVEYVNSAT